jgi:hypothetical protein
MATTTNDSKSMVRLGEDSGKAPTISYNVPEPTSYSGRYFVEIKFGATGQTLEIFSDNIIEKIIDRNRDQQAFSVNTVQDIEEAMINGFSDGVMFPHVGQYAGLIRLQKNSDGGYEMKSNLSLSPELVKLSPQEVYSAMRAGKSLMVYRSSFGTLTYEYIITRSHIRAVPVSDTFEGIAPSSRSATRSKIKQAKEMKSLAAAVPGRKGGGSINIISPADGATLVGLTRGITINLTGVTENMVVVTRRPRTFRRRNREDGNGIDDDGDGIEAYEVPATKVEVEIGQGNGFERAQPAANDWSSWSFSKFLTTQGEFIITSRADYGIDTREHKITIKVSLEDSNDRTPPNITISSPADGATIQGPDSRVVVNITGTAIDEADGSGVQEVYVQIGSQNKFELARPNSIDNWSSWSFSGIITSQGEHTITAIAVDKGGNKASSQAKIKVSFTPETPRKLLYRPRLFLIETYRLSSFLGQYGAGRTIKTFSLLPGEKTKISIKTYSKTEQEAKEASSILDSVTNESTKDFESTLAREQSNKQGYQESFSYEINAKAEASWGFGSAEISGGVKGGTNASREEFAKNVSNTTQKHASKASAKRDVQINTSYERKEQTGEETSIEREIENINLSRTLNFVFRQMNQEYITLLHLVDVRVAFWDGDPNPAISMRKEVPLADVDSLLNSCIKEEKRNEVLKAIIDQLNSIIDYQGNVVTDFVEEKILRNGEGNEVRRYWRVNSKSSGGNYTDETGNQITVQGLILSANKYVMRTDGVIVEALLGQGDALDTYSHGLQDQAVKEKELKNVFSQTEINRNNLGITVVQQRDADSAKIFGQVFPCCKHTIFSLWPPKDSNENSQERFDKE